MGVPEAVALLSLAGSGYAAYSQHKQASAEQEAAEQAADYNASVIAEHSRLESSRKRRLAKRELAAQRVAYAKAGVRLEGSPLDVLASNAAAFEEDIFFGELEASRRAGYEHLQKKAAKAMGRAGRRAAGATLLTGGAGAAGTYYGLGGKWGS